MSPPTLSPSVVNSLSSSPDWESWSSTLLNCRRSSACSELRGKMKPMWTGANLNWGRGGSRAPQFSYNILHRFMYSSQHSIDRYQKEQPCSLCSWQWVLVPISADQRCVHQS